MNSQQEALDESICYMTKTVYGNIFIKPET
jgi:hypothetical protein